MISPLLFRTISRIKRFGSLPLCACVCKIIVGNVLSRRRKEKASTFQKEIFLLSFAKPSTPNSSPPLPKATIITPHSCIHHVIHPSLASLPVVKISFFISLRRECFKTTAGFLLPLLIFAALPQPSFIEKQ